MKKSKLSITLVTGFIAAMAMAACDSVTASKNALVTFTPYGSEEKVVLITDDVYNSYRGTSSGITKFYDKILEVLIRYEFKEKNFDKGELKYSEIESWAKNQVNDQKDKARTAAKNNEGTTYDEEWKDILDGNGVKDEKGLLEKFIYDKEKEVIKNWYADNAENAAALKEEFLGVKADGSAVASDVKAAMPYHIRHILIKVEEASDTAKKFYKGTVSETQAKLLYDTVSTLAEGQYTFSEVAKNYSEDTSNVSGGDVGIVTNTATSGALGMVNEFQLGLYAYDNLYNADNVASPAANTIKAGLGITANVTNALANNITEVPYEAFVNMRDYAEVTADKEGNKLADGSASLYPRNIIWNKYFNLHDVFVIKNVKKAPYVGLLNPKDEFATDSLVSNVPYDATLPRFNANGYLVDEKGNVIVGVRSQYGIHLMVIEKSMYEYASLSQYYDTKLPGDEGYNEDSYVGYVQSHKVEDYKKRADEVKNKISSFDATYDYRLYQYLTDKVTISFTGPAEGLDEKIDAYIAATKSNNAYKQEDGLFKSWRTYTELLAKQEYDRSVQYTTYNGLTGAPSPILTRLVPEKIADDFFKLYNDPSAPGMDAIYKEFAEGGDYYYYA
ncbi:MAG TPA: hypothetical protein GX010_01065 [Erysipelotrichaceae bacterium]|nr:hypothetical protein [Erysipelotrichaceae bacterium]